MPDEEPRFGAEHRRRFKGLSLLPCHYLVRIYAPDKVSLVGMMVFRISPMNATDQAEYVSPELHHYRWASRRRPFMDLAIRGYGWREYGREKALAQAKKQAEKAGRGWLFKEPTKRR